MPKVGSSALGSNQCFRVPHGPARLVTWKGHVRAFPELDHGYGFSGDPRQSMIPNRGLTKPPSFSIRACR